MEEATMRWKSVKAGPAPERWCVAPTIGPRLRSAVRSAARVLLPTGLETTDHLNDHQLRDIGLSRDSSGRLGAPGSCEIK
jgi:hypothetical protein